VPPAAAPTQDAPGRSADPTAGTAQSPPAAAEPAGSSGGALGLVEVRRLWPDILEAVKRTRRYTWILLSQNAQVTAVDDKTLTIALVNAGARNSFMSGGSEEILRQAAIDVIGHDWRVEAVVDPSAQPGVGIESSGPRSTYSPTRPDDTGGTAPDGGGPASAEPGPGPAVPAPEPDAGGGGAAPAGPQAGTGGGAAPGQPGGGPEAVTPGAGPAEPAEPARRPVDPSAVASAREAIQDTRPAGAGRSAVTMSVSDDDVSPDDADADDDLAGTELLQRELGARVIEEIKHD